MDPLPKVARDRLRASPSAEHPDADLLTAFAERSLSERERMQVADHLSRCAGCRQVVAVAVPETEPMSAAALSAQAAGPIPAVQRRFWRSRVLRWGALAACVVVVSAAVLTYRRNFRIQPYQPLTAHEVNDVAAQEQAEHQPTTERQQATLDELEPKLKAEAPVRADQVLKRGRMAVKPATPRAQPGPVVAKKAPSALSETVVVEASKDAPAQTPMAANEVAGASRQMATAPPPPPAAKAGETNSGAVGGLAGKQSVEFSAVTAAMAQRQDAASLQKSNVQEEKADTSMNATTARPTAQFASRIAQAGADELAAPRPPKWSLSPGGLPQRSVDSGATWSEVTVDGSRGFRALSAVGRDVWVGGAKGLLYHSPDNGLHWIRIVPSVGGAQLNADISRIEFTDTLHGQLQTADGAKWTTTDGGKTWQTH
jgi:hypothetical protein